MPPRRAMIVLITAVLTLLPVVTTAQDATPAASTGTMLDLAAMSLAPDDIPAGYFDDYSEWWVPSASLSEFVLGGQAPPAGLEQLYQTFYSSNDQPAAIHSFLFAFASADDAAAGAAIVDEVLRPPLPDGTTVGPTTSPASGMGDDSQLVTFVAYDTWAAGGPRADVVAVSFRRDRVVAGVSVERFTDPPPDGTPVAASATPVAADPAQEALAAELATVLDGRITDVLAGRAPAGVDLALADVVLPLDQLADGPTPMFGGYKSGVDLLRCGICGEENSLLPLADAALGGFNRGLLLGPVVDGEPSPPFVSVTVSAFSSPEAALAVLEAIRAAPNDRPTSIPVPRGARTLAADPVVSQATAALAFQGALDAEDPDAPADSAGVDFVVGDRLVFVDVQGGLTSEAAMAAAVDLATQQAACLAADGPCATATLPPSLQAAASG